MNIHVLVINSNRIPVITYLFLLVSLVFSVSSYAAQHNGKVATNFYTTAYNGSACASFKLDGVSKADPNISSSGFFQIPFYNTNYDYISAHLLKSIETGALVDVTTDGKYCGETARVVATSLHGDFYGMDGKFVASYIKNDSDRRNVLSLENDTAYFRLDNPIPISDYFTVSAWVKDIELNDGGWNTLFRSTNHHRPIILDKNGFLGTYLGGFSNSGYNLLAHTDPKEWNMITAVGSSSKVDYYVNGEWVGDAEFTRSGSNIFLIGNRDGAGGQRFSRYVDDPKIFQHAMSADEVKMLYLHTRAIPMGDLTGLEYKVVDGHYALDKERGQILRFTSINGRIELYQPIPLGNKFSMLMWFNKLSPQGNNRWRTIVRGDSYDHPAIVDKDSQNLGLYANKRSSGDKFVSSGYDMSYVETGWHQIAIVWNRPTMTYYIDGEPVASIQENLLQDTAFSFNNYWKGGQLFAKEIDDLMIARDQAYSETEIKNLYEATRSSEVHFDTYVTNISSPVGQALANISLPDNAADTFHLPGETELTGNTARKKTTIANLKAIYDNGLLVSAPNSPPNSSPTAGIQSEALIRSYNELLSGSSSIKNIYIAEDPTMYGLRIAYTSEPDFLGYYPGIAAHVNSNGITSLRRSLLDPVQINNGGHTWWANQDPSARFGEVIATGNTWDQEILDSTRWRRFFFGKNAPRNYFLELDIRENGRRVTATDVHNKIHAAYNQLFRTGGSNEIIVYNTCPPNTDPCFISEVIKYVYDDGKADIRSEGMSYGMMISLMMDDKTMFEALWRFTKSYMMGKTASQGHAMPNYFSWSLEPRPPHNYLGEFGFVPAPDAEEFIVAALFLAAQKWGDQSYRNDAELVLDDMLATSDHPEGVLPLFDPDANQIVFSPITATRYTDPSYHVPAFYELMAQHTLSNANALRLRQIADVSRNFFSDAIKDCGLFSEYAEFDGGLPINNDANNENYRNSFSDSYRVISNMASDYRMYSEDPDLAELVERNLNFYLEEIAEHGDYTQRYELETPNCNRLSGARPTTGQIAMNATGALALPLGSEISEQFVQALWDAEVPSGSNRYFDAFLYLFGLLHVSGEFHKEFRPNMLDLKSEH